MTRRRVAALLAVSALVAMSFPGAVAGNPAAHGGSDFASAGVYLVLMTDSPVVAYEGGTPGLKATAPRAGQKIDPNAPSVVTYAAYLKGRHDAALAGVGGAQKLYDYVYSNDGFAARLTAAQANKLSATAGVMSVTPDQTYTVDTSSTPSFLGLDATGGIWSQLGGVKGAGDGVIIGIIDSGIWPESLSFADRVDTNGAPSADPKAKLAYQQIPGWHGKCTPGEAFNASMCNQKLIGAQWFDASWGGDAGIAAERPWEFTSARDYNGHGTHTSSTAGGNYGVSATGPAAVFGKISGMAPRARIAMYKALWSTKTADTASGSTSDLVAAIDQAVADGVDVINYSISGTLTNFADPVEISYLFAARAGIFVAESAGNSGPATATVAHPAPWTTTVAAGTHNRDGQGSVTLGNGTTYYGASVATPVGPVGLIDATAGGVSGADPTKLALCYGEADGAVTLDSAKVKGKIVVCDRGVTARINKSLAVQQAGGLGMILVNTSTNSINADFHYVPTVHLQASDRDAIKAYAASSAATATINQATIVYNAPAPFTASFSSRGPLLAGGGNLLKPDLIAPGQDILAAVSPAASGRNFDLYSGTSMSSPHVAGLAALLKQLHPNWSPMAIKSALMTTGYDVLDGPSTSPTVIFRQGAGHVQPNKAADPGLVFDAGWNDWLAFLCGGAPSSVSASTCSALTSRNYSTDLSDYNSASIAVGALAGSKTVHRTLTNASSSPATYTATVTGGSGLTISFDQTTFTVAPGASARVKITIARTTADVNLYTGAQITWSDGTHSVRIPVVVKPVALAAPAQVSGTGGSISYNVTFGYSGPFMATPRGLVAADVSAGTVADDPTDSSCSLASPNAQLIPVSITDGTTYARFALFDADVKAGSDLDLCVYRGQTQVGMSGGGTAQEEVNLVDPVAADYTVVVQGWGVQGSTPFKLYTWLLGSGAAANMAVTAPAEATTGTVGTIGLTFTDLSAGTKYLGSVAYGGSVGMPNPTIVRVDVP